MASRRDQEWGGVLSSVRAIAYVHGPARVIALGNAFAAGCHVHGVECEVRRVDELRAPEPVDVVWHYGLGPARPVFDAYEGRARRVIGDVRYWRGSFPRSGEAKRRVRISIDDKQPDRHLRLRVHPPDRFRALGIKVEPVLSRGESILLTGSSISAALAGGMEYGQWERKMVERLRGVTARPIVIREKPRNPPIVIPDVRIVDPEKQCAGAIRSSWAVVCKSGGIGADAILHGVPVWSESGPGAVYGTFRLEDIDRAEPLRPEARMSALCDLAYWQWSVAEIAAGDLWAHLRDEGVVCA